MHACVWKKRARTGGRRSRRPCRRSCPWSCRCTRSAATPGPSTEQIRLVNGKSVDPFRETQLTLSTTDLAPRALDHPAPGAVRPAAGAVEAGLSVSWAEEADALHRGGGGGRGGLLGVGVLCRGPMSVNDVQNVSMSAIHTGNKCVRAHGRTSASQSSPASSSASASAALCLRAQDGWNRALQPGFFTIL